MDFEVVYEPVYLLKIRNFFDKDINKQILKEALGNESDFQRGRLMGNVVDDNIRTNDIAEYDNLYLNRREDSVLLSSIDTILQKNQEFRQAVMTSPFPLSELTSTTRHELQVSRYGNDNQKFEWHHDRYEYGMSRIITLVYYFFNEPKQFEGGEICFSKSPVVHSKLIDPDAEQINIVPENNMAVVFASNTSHYVMPTKSSEKFDEGRFSVNCWIGV